MMRQWPIVLLISAAFRVAVGSTCLADGIPPERRKNLVNVKLGETYPLGMHLNDWAASYASSAVAKILLEEKLGYNVTERLTGAATVDAYFAVAGCLTPTIIGNRGCGDGPAVTYSHVSLEAWTEGYAATWEQIQTDYPATAPVNVGNMGYDGKVSFYIGRGVKEAAWESEGLNLDFFRGYNISWHLAAKYFDPPSVVNNSLLLPCNVTRLWISRVMQFYAELTGDWDGVDVNDGVVTAKCWEGKFWYAPSCRGNSSGCFVFLTGGNGWDLENSMQKATAWNMPMACATALNWKWFTNLPLQHDMMFYWWVPDPTFLSLSPLEVAFPPHDRQAHLRGDKRTSMSTTSVDICVSKDLRVLAPDAQNLFENWDISLKQVDHMLLDQMNTGDGWDVTACRWLQNNEETWSKWLPDSTTCFAQFGLYNSVTKMFVENRDDPTNLECLACPSGSFSRELVDSTGLTHTCALCPVGTAQPLGAAVQCDQCDYGTYQDEVGQTACKPCKIGAYQDEKGQGVCKVCPTGMTTLGLRGRSPLDCGCAVQSIDIGQAGEPNCVSCGPAGEYLKCPFGSTIQALQSGQAELGEAFVPEIEAGYYSTDAAPLEVYMCANTIQCPGGEPGTCGGGLEGIPCAECPGGETWSGTVCESCTAWSVILWMVSVVAIFVFLTCAYYLLTSQVTAKASVMATTGMSFGMTVNLLQSVGIIGMMTVEWPGELQGILSAFKVLLLDIDNYSFSCFAGPITTVRYINSVVFFFLGQFWLLLNFGISRILPKRFAWDAAKTGSTMGQFWQVGFSTMSTVALAPLTCYTHPNGMQSLLKYPNIICGGDGHGVMLVFGILLLSVGVFGFLALCIYAATMMPKWSASDRRHLVQGFRFLVFRFRLDSWWYGVPLLVRGPLLSLPIVLATDYPPMQTIFVNVILAVFLIIETLSWPWKVPLLNLVDMWMTLCLMLLVMGSALYLEPVEGAMKDFAAGFSTAVMVCIGMAMLMMAIVATAALVHRAAMGGAQEYSIFNMGKVAPAPLVYQRLIALSAELQKLDESWVQGRIASMSAFDIRLITGCITLLAIDCVPHKADELKFNFARVSAQSFAVRGKTQKNIYKENVHQVPSEENALSSAAELAAELALDAPELAPAPGVAEAAIVETTEDNRQAGPFKSGWV